MGSLKPNVSDWLDRLDIQAVPDWDDKVQECEFFFDALMVETDRRRFRWFVSAFLNAAYSFFESSALTAYFRFTDSEGNTREDSQHLEILRRHVRVVRSQQNPNFVKTAGLSPITKQLYEFRKKGTHHFSHSIMAAGPSLPDEFQFGNMKGEGTPVVPMCRDVLDLVKAVYSEANS